MKSTPFPTGHAVLVAICLLTGALWSVPVAAQSATAAFRLGTGHAARQELCFAVGGPGTIDVQVESDVAGEVLNVTLYAGTTPVHSAQGDGRIAFSVPATREHLMSGEEWAITLTSTLRASTAAGRIRVTFPERPNAGAHPLDTWLRARPALAFHMTWNEAGQPAPYSAWPRGMRQRLWAIYDELAAGRPGPVPDPPPNAWQGALATIRAPSTPRFGPTSLARCT